MIGKYLKDHEAKPSTMRLMSFLAMLSAVGLSFVQYLGDSTGDPQIILYFLIAAFAPKAVQRFAEKKDAPV